jgi:chaperonin GroEL
MPAKQVAFDEDARSGLKAGAALLSRAVRVTLGPRGRNVVLQKSFGAPLITKDGASIAKEVELSDHYENLGAQLIETAASKTNDDAGDGTTTAITLAYDILESGMKAITSGRNPMALKRGIDEACAAVIERLHEQSTPVSGRDDYARVASVSANGDTEIGDIIADALETVGSEGVVTVEEGKSAETTLEVVEGMQFDKGFLSARFATEADGSEAVLDNPYILIHDGKLSSPNDVVAILEKIHQVGRPILIIAEDVEGEALSTLVVNRVRGNLAVCAVKAPGFGDRRKEMLRDIGTLTGGQVIAEELGIRLENVVLGMLGEAERVIVDKDNTTIVRGRGSSEDIEGRKRQIRAQIEDTTSDYDSEKLQERLAKLAGGVGLIDVGGATEVAMKEKKARVEDALNATRAAIEEGILPGGGVALIRSQSVLDALIDARSGADGTSEDEDELAGIRIVRQSLEAPLRQLAENAGAEASLVAANVRSADSDAYGYNAQTLEYEDLAAAGICDPTKVVRSALQNACSVAGIVLTTEAAITEAPSGEDSGHHGHSHGPGQHRH